MCSLISHLIRSASYAFIDIMFDGGRRKTLSTTTAKGSRSRTSTSTTTTRTTVAATKTATRKRRTCCAAARCDGALARVGGAPALAAPGRGARESEESSSWRRKGRPRRWSSRSRVVSFRRARARAAQIAARVPPPSWAATAASLSLARHNDPRLRGSLCSAVVARRRVGLGRVWGATRPLSGVWRRVLAHGRGGARPLAPIKMRC